MRFNNSLELVLLIGWLLSGRLWAQSFTVLHSFSGADGANPAASLLVVSNRMYGTSSEYWGSRNGTVFAINTDGSGFETLHRFSTPIIDQDSGAYTNSDGATPMAGLILSGNRLYGTAYKGGSLGAGTVFAINTDGTGFTTLHSFNDYEGAANPWAPLILSRNTLYGTTYNSWSLGTVFALNTDGTGFTVVHEFNGDDGIRPMAGLILSGDTLYGTTSGGGSSNAGVVFKVNIDGTGFTNLHVFSNSDGNNPGNAGLILAGNTLYGATFFGGTTFSSSVPGYGTVFKLQTDGSGFTNLHSFTPAPDGTTSDGAHPTSGVILSGDILYGTAAGGVGGSGTVFAMNINGTGFATLHNFNALSPPPEPYTNSDGAGPQGGLVISGNSLYGTAIAGGSGYGTIFSISLPVAAPQLSITTVAGNVMLSWPTNVAGFSLQSTTDLSSTASWTAVSQRPIVLNGQNTVTVSRETAITGQARFYRLVH